MDNLTFFRNLIDLQRRMDAPLCEKVFGDHLGAHIWETHFVRTGNFKFYKFDLKSQQTLVEYIENNPTV